MSPEAPQASSKRAWHQHNKNRLNNNKSLDHVPMRSQTSSSRARDLPQQVLYPKLIGLPSPSPPPVEPQSYSPTSSEIDALEASYFDYEAQSSNAVDGPGISTVASQKASSANYIQDDDTDSTTSSSYLSLPDTADGTLVDAPKSLKDRLRSVWRMLTFFAASPRYCMC